MSGKRYVDIRELDAALKGHETEILDQLGIDWRAASTPCPYPDHEHGERIQRKYGGVSATVGWRWDPRRAGAVCTCISRGHTDSIFHVAGKMLGLTSYDPESTLEIWLAEHIGRSDLIHTAVDTPTQPPDEPPAEPAPGRTMGEIERVRVLRQAYWANGYRPIAIWSPGACNSTGQPIRGAGKRPVGEDWRQRALRDPPDAVTASVSSMALNTGVVTGEIGGVDVDVLSPVLADTVVHRVEHMLGPTPLVRTGRPPKTLLVYRLEQPLGKLATPALFLPDGTKVQIEVLAAGQQFVCEGVHPDTGQPYRWTDGSPADVAIGALPIVDEAMLRDMLDEVEHLLREAGAVEKKKPRPERRSRRASSGQGSDFFRNVNSAALTDIGCWVPKLFPDAKLQATGAWRVSSADLGRDLEEDLSIHPDGITDFGEEEPRTAIDLVIEHGDAADAFAAARWLCEQLGVEPASLGWHPSNGIDEAGLADFQKRIGTGTFDHTKPSSPGAKSQLPGGTGPDREPEPGIVDPIVGGGGSDGELPPPPGTGGVGDDGTGGGEAPPPPGDDLGARNKELPPPRQQRQCPPAVGRETVFTRKPNWRTDLLKNAKGQIRACLANAIIALRHAPEWDDRLWFDMFHNRVVLRGATPWSSKAFDDEPWSDLFDNLATDWLQHHGVYVSHEITGRAVWTVAHDQWFHPVRQYFGRCRRSWDGQKRVFNWPTTYLGTPHDAYSTAVGRRWLISLVARIMDPGCKADSALVLEGPQGIFKSEVLRRLGWPWVTDDMGGAPLGSKDAALQVAGVWIMELAELDQFTTGRDVAKTKSFMSRMTDRFRPPYGTHPIPQPRQCCFGCTTNKSEYLPDETGNRRWWPLICTGVDLAQLDIDRDQLFGEAVALYEAGEPWWLDTLELTELAATEQDQRYVPDAWDDVIRNYLDHPTDERWDRDGRPFTVNLPPIDSVTIGEILGQALGMPPSDWRQPEQNRVARCLRALKWTRHQRRNAGDREWRYFRPEED
jgi:predicted P-loop ATPase